MTRNRISVHFSPSTDVLHWFIFFAGVGKKERPKVLVLLMYCSAGATTNQWSECNEIQRRKKKLMHSTQTYARTKNGNDCGYVGRGNVNKSNLRKKKLSLPSHSLQCNFCYCQDTITDRIDQWGCLIRIVYALPRFTVVSQYFFPILKNLA